MTRLDPDPKKIHQKTVQQTDTLLQYQIFYGRGQEVFEPNTTRPIRGQCEKLTRHTSTLNSHWLQEHNFFGYQEARKFVGYQTLGHASY